MSAKLFVLTHYADIHKIGENLMLPMENPFNDVLEPKYYDIDFSPIIYGQNAFLHSNSGIPYYHYCVPEKGTSSELRIRHFDLVRALGLNEAWAMNEMITDAIDDFYEPSQSLEDMINAMVKYAGYTVCPEFDIRSYDESKGIHGIYHDQFKDCFDLVEKIENKFNVIVLGLKRFQKHYIRVLSGDRVHLLNVETGESVDFAG